MLSKHLYTVAWRGAEKTDEYTAVGEGQATKHKITFTMSTKVHPFLAQSFIPDACSQLLWVYFFFYCIQRYAMGIAFLCFTTLKPIYITSTSYHEVMRCIIHEADYTFKQS